MIVELARVVFEEKPPLVALGLFLFLVETVKRLLIKREEIIMISAKEKKQRRNARNRMNK